MGLFRRKESAPEPEALPGDRVAVGYHQRSKHHFQRFAASLGFLDWANQPDPFRRFEGAELLPLAHPGDDDVTTPYAALYAGADAPLARRPLDHATLSCFFFHSLALSAWKRFGDNRWSLRVNPSSGNLHPTEGWVLLDEAVLGAASGSSSGPGLLHYAPKEHALERRAHLDAELWSALTRELPDGAFLVALSSIPWREGWKYGERAWRYCQHDVGHALAALRLAAALLGWRLTCVPAVDDAFLAALLGLDREDAAHEHEAEVPDLLAVVTPDGAPIDPGTLAFGADLVPLGRRSRFAGRANELSAEHHPWEILDVVETACRKSLAGRDDRWPGRPTTADTREPGIGPEPTRGAEPVADATPETGPAPTAQPEPAPEPAAPEPAPEPAAPAPTPTDAPELRATRIIRQRRSAVSLDRRTTLPAARFYEMLTRLVPALTPAPWDALGLPAFVHLGLFVHRVDGLPPGLYALVRSPDAEADLRAAMRDEFRWETPPDCPPDLPLFLLLPVDARAAATQVSCTQDIAGDGAFSLGMLARFDTALTEHGAPLYRHLFWETGVIGQVLYLEAEAAGIRATGIGCFFDDPVHQVFGISDASFQSLYHFTVGGPVEDLRLSTEPAYPSAPGSHVPPPAKPAP